jgi:hypothetical protein
VPDKIQHRANYREQNRNQRDDGEHEERPISSSAQAFELLVALRLSKGMQALSKHANECSFKKRRYRILWPVWHPRVEIRSLVTESSDSDWDQRQDPDKRERRTQVHD